MRNHSLLPVALLLGIFVLGSTGCKGFFVSGSTLDHINVTPSSVYLKATETDQFSASAVNVDGTTKDVTSAATWASSATSIATVNTAGQVTAVAAGNTVVSATQSGVTGNAKVVVGAQALNTTLTVGPNNPTVTHGQTVQLSATGTLADNSTLDLTHNVTWTSGNTANATVDANGVVTGVTAGQTATITATIATATSSATGSVTVTVQ